MSKLFVVAAACLAFAGAASAETGAGTAPTAATDPDWISQPTFADQTAAYPPKALKQGVSGQTVMGCTVKADGALADCALVSEEPAGLGFGPAALSLADRFRARPQAGAGAETPRKVRIPIRWKVVTEARWARQPNGDQLAELFPSPSHGGGEARVKCTVKADGTLTDCSILSEAPAGGGFGQATLKATRYFQMAPGTPGDALEGATVVIPVNWRIAGQRRPVFSVGEDADLITILENGKGPPIGQWGVFACPSSTDRARRCQTHRVSWREKPSDASALEAMTRSRLGDDLNKISCKVGDDGALKDCVVIGKATPAQEAAMRALAGDLKANMETSDGVPVQWGRIVIRFDWPQLLRAAKAAAERR